MESHRAHPARPATLRWRRRDVPLVVERSRQNLDVAETDHAQQSPESQLRPAPAQRTGPVLRVLGRWRPKQVLRIAAVLLRFLGRARLAVALRHGERISVAAASKQMTPGLRHRMAAMRRILLMKVGRACCGMAFLLLSMELP